MASGVSTVGVLGVGANKCTSEKEEGIFNPNCKCITLLNTIRDRCVDNEEEIDLSDETGSVKNLREFPHKYANELLTERERLVLLRVDRQDNGDSTYTPLLNDTDAVNEQFLSQLASKSNAGVSGGGRRNRSSSSRRTPTRNASNKKDVPDNRSIKSQSSVTKKDKSGTARAKSRAK